MFLHPYSGIQIAYTRAHSSCFGCPQDVRSSQTEQADVMQDKRKLTFWRFDWAPTRTTQGK